MASSLFGVQGSNATNTRTNSTLDPKIAQMYQALKVAQDPNAMMQNMITSNPKLSQLMGIVNMFGGDPKTAFFNEAKRKGVDPNTILNMFR